LLAAMSVAKPMPASGISLAVAGSAAGDCSGMHCVTRPRGDSFSGSSGIPPAAAAIFAAVFFAAGPAGSGRVVVAWRAGRPPGRPGLPLPLFLGVSRT
jgi:hypothetical protein